MSNYWLMKSEPSDYSIHDLKKDKKTGWDGIRNYQARNLMRDKMQLGDKVLFYHSNAKPPGVAGLATVSKLGIPDHTQWDSKSKYFDPKSTKEAPRWVMVELQFVEILPKFIPLPLLKTIPELEELMVIKKGMRLSIQPVNEIHFKHICRLGQSKIES